jgi:hypothetical protein
MAFVRCYSGTDGSKHTTASTPSGGMPGRAGGVAPAGRPFRLRDRECERFVAPTPGARNSLPASQQFSTRSVLFCTKSARRLVGITVGHIGADRRAKVPIAHPLPAV